MLAPFLLLGCASGRDADPPAAPSHAGPRSHASTRLVTPTASPPAPSARPPAVAALTSPLASLSGYLADRSGRVTAALYDEVTGTTWTLHPGMLQDTASIVKVQIMATALSEAQAAGGHLPAAEAMLMPSMIENSDNQSATTLLADVGGAGALARFDRSVGMDHTTPSALALIPGTSWPGWGLTTTTARDEVTLVSQFAYPGPALSGAARDYGLSLMEHVETDQAWGVSAGAPAGSTIALKNGWLPLGPSDWQINSIGWIDGHGRNYVLAVLTDGNPTQAYGIATIEHIARAVFAGLGPAPGA
ncbi:MAG: serine hydrolase [Streptosporangiaceae bacterium]